MKTIFTLGLALLCVITAMVAFADVISLGNVREGPAVVLFLGFGLLGLAGIARRRI